MLRLSPRTITAAVLAFFLFAMLLRHATEYYVSQRTDINAKEISSSLKENFPGLSWLERLDYDLHLRYVKTDQHHSDVVVVEISERTIQALGQFPFPRSVFADLVRRLEQFEAKVTAFDITFPERESHGLEQLALEAEKGGIEPNAIKALRSLLQKKGGDAAFADALKNTNMPVVLGWAFTGIDAETGSIKDNDPRNLEILNRYAMPWRLLDPRNIESLSSQIAIIPHGGLLESLSGRSSLGHFLANADADSVIRRALVVVEYRGSIYPSLAAMAVDAYLGGGQLIADGELGLRIRDKEARIDFPISSDGNTLLRYYGGDRVFPYIDMADVMSKDPVIQAKMKDQLKGKIVFIGATAEGLKDIRANPFTARYPGVEIHATVASNLLRNHFLVRDSRYFIYGYLFIIALGLVVAVLVFNAHPVLVFPVILALLVAFQFAAHELFFVEGVIVPTILPSISALTVLFTGVFYRYFTEEKEKRQVRTAFSRYVSGPVVEEILMDPSKLKLGGQKKVLTVMFCDLMGFTKLSENMDATQLTTLLNEYFTRMTKIILRNKGTLDKYMGDAVMCFWGAPLDIPNHAELACQSALEMSGELDKINHEWKLRYGITIGLRIGVHSGEMNVGNMGSEQVFSYTVMGDNVNLGSRLEGVNNVYGTTVIVSGDTAKLVGNKFVFRALDKVQVKGKEEAVEILELVSSSAERKSHEEWLHAFDAGLQAYRTADWDGAQAYFSTCLQLKADDQPARVFLERIKELRACPKEKWDGVWKMNSK